MLLSEILERFLLGYGLKVQGDRGRPANITSLLVDAQKEHRSCTDDELLDALYNSRPENVRIDKFVNEESRFLPLDRSDPAWKDFFYTGYFNIKTLPPGRLRLEKLSEQLDRETRDSERRATGGHERRQSQDDDRTFAVLAIQEARQSVPESDGRPHPKVGAVVVKNGKVLSSAHRGERPENHAEYIALEKKLPDEAVAGATVYTTLEPCTTRNHPKIPCADRLIERKVARVVIGMLDPDDRISGKGQRKLRKAGIITDLFPHDLAMEVEELNREFTRYCEQPRQVATSAASSVTPPHQGSGETKLGTILSYKGKAVTVVNRTKTGPYFSESYWPYETFVEDCNSLWVTLKNEGGPTSFPLSQVQVSFDNEKKRLRLEIDRY